MYSAAEVEVFFPQFFSLIHTLQFFVLKRVEVSVVKKVSIFRTSGQCTFTLFCSHLMSTHYFTECVSVVEQLIFFFCKEGSKGSIKISSTLTPYMTVSSQEKVSRHVYVNIFPPVPTNVVFFLFFLIFNFYYMLSTELHTKFSGDGQGVGGITLIDQLQSCYST